MVPHLDVHRRRQKDATPGRDVERREKIVGDPVGKLGEDVRSGGHYRKQLSPLRHSDMLNLEILVRLKHPGDYPLTGESLESQRCNELLRGLGQYDLDGYAGLLQATHDFNGFVGGNTSGHSQCNVHTTSGSTDFIPVEAPVSLCRESQS